MARYFTQSDLDAFKEEHAESADQAVIENREIVRDKFFNLHNKKLGAFMESKELYPHYIPENLTSDIHPRDENQGYVNHIKMGYGKSDYDVDTLIKLAGEATHLSSGFSSSDIDFNTTTQLQLSLDSNFLTVAFYLDHRGWIELINLEKKSKYRDENIQQLYQLANSAVELGYTLYLYTEEGPEEYDDCYDFISDLLNLVASGEHPAIHIFKCIDLDGDENEEEYIASYIAEEFDNLLPLYNFISWNSTDNNYIWI
ncbi:MAG: hypothetical protein RR730_06930 [Clostridium sp.]